MNTIELITTFISKILISLAAATGLMLSTEKVIINVNFFSFFAVIICAIIFAYGLYSLIRDWPKLYQLMRGK